MNKRFKVYAKMIIAGGIISIIITVLCLGFIVKTVSSRENRDAAIEAVRDEVEHVDSIWHHK